VFDHCRVTHSKFQLFVGLVLYCDLSHMNFEQNEFESLQEFSAKNVLSLERH